MISPNSLKNQKKRNVLPAREGSPSDGKKEIYRSVFTNISIPPFKVLYLIKVVLYKSNLPSFFQNFVYWLDKIIHDFTCTKLTKK